MYVLWVMVTMYVRVQFSVVVMGSGICMKIIYMSCQQEFVGRVLEGFVSYSAAAYC